MKLFGPRPRYLIRVPVPTFRRRVDMVRLSLLPRGPAAAAQWRVETVYSDVMGEHEGKDPARLKRRDQPRRPVPAWPDEWNPPGLRSGSGPVGGTSTPAVGAPIDVDAEPGEVDVRGRTDRRARCRGPRGRARGTLSDHGARSAGRDRGHPDLTDEPQVRLAASLLLRCRGQRACRTESSGDMSLLRAHLLPGDEPALILGCLVAG